jgi:hypothetical protein
MDFTRAVASIKIMDDDYHLLFPLFKKVLDAVTAVKDKNQLEQNHKQH